jgi:peptidyl-prolyl cis-trans isomerase D
MFDFVRKHTKIMMFLMFLLIIPAFVLVGVDGFRRINGSGAAVAKVGGQGITQIEWDAAHKSEVDRLRQSVPNVDPKLLDSPAARYATLERMVRERVLAEQAQGAHLMTTNTRLARELQQNPTIASLRKPDGTLDMERYRQLAASQGLTPEGFEASVRNNLSVQQVELGVTGSALVLPALANVALNALFERREVQIAKFLPADFFGKVNPSDAEIEAYYKENPGLFQAPESANLEYLVLDLDTVKKTITLSESDVRTYYEQNAARLSGKEERRASHILIAAPKTLAQDARQKAKDQALALLAQVRKLPESFADVARKNSQDTGSANKGGDLDYFSRGAMVKPFEEAAFSLKKGEISDLIETDFGFHIIKITDIKSPRVKSFDELRPTIEADLKAQQAQRKFAEVAETFTNGVYEQSDALKPVADKLKLELRTAENVQRKTVAPGSGVLANPKLLAAIFSSESIDKKRNTEAIEIAPSQLVSARITQYTAARTLPFADVRAQARERLLAVRSADLARKEGNAKLAAWKADPKTAVMPPAVTVSRDQNQGVSAKLLDAILRADPVQLPSWAGVDLGAEGFAIVRVNNVLVRNPASEDKARQEQSQFAQWMAGAESQAYYEVLKDRFKVQVKVPKPVAASNAGANLQE